MEWILDTHIHADHITASGYLKKKTGGKTAIGEFVVLVQNHFQGVFNLEVRLHEFELMNSEF